MLQFRFFGDVITINSAIEVYVETTICVEVIKAEAYIEL